MTVSTSNSFKPAFWLPEGHSQTLWRKFAGAELVPHHRERIELSDGDFIDLDWSHSSPAQIQSREPDSPIVLIVHGLCGCSESSYVLALQQELNSQGINSVVMNLRGCSGEVNSKARTYHSGVSDDLDEVFNTLSSRYPNQQFVVIGYSLGGNVLLKWLGECGEQQRELQPVKAIAVSTPFTLAHCSRAMLQGFSKIYGRYFTRRLLASLEAKKQHFLEIGEHDELEKLNALGDTNSISSIWEFDDRITAPLHGFADAEDYYQRCSSISYLGDISAETLLIQSVNDPMIPASALPKQDQLSDSVQFELQENGGHVGFVAGLGKRWLEERILRFILSP